MARAFASASSQYLENTNAVVGTAPFTMACWAYAAATGVANQAIMGLGTSVTTVGRHILFFGGTGFSPNNSIAAQSISNDGATGGTALSASTYSATTWTHVAGVWTSSTPRTAYINGSAGTAETTSIAPTGLDRTNIGCRWNVSRGLFLNGRAAEAGIWNVALTTAEIAQLADGFSPLTVRPASLVAYWPMFGRLSPENDRVGGFSLTLGASPTQVAHPRVIYPSRPYIIKAPAAAGGTTVARLVNGGLVHGGTLLSGRLVREAA